MMNCNGGGQCGFCAVRVSDGAFGPRYEWEERHVAKLGADARLACQTTVKGGDAATVTLQAERTDAPAPAVGASVGQGRGCR